MQYFLLQMSPNNKPHETKSEAIPQDPEDPAPETVLQTRGTEIESAASQPHEEVSSCQSINVTDIVK